VRLANSSAPGHGRDGGTACDAPNHRFRHFGAGLEARAGPWRWMCSRAALILCADHELNVSSFNRPPAWLRAGSNPYARRDCRNSQRSKGPRTRRAPRAARVESMLASMRRGGAILRGRRRTRGCVRGEPIDGFGHPLYPKRAILARRCSSRCCASVYAKSAELTFVPRNFAGTRLQPPLRENAERRFSLLAGARSALLGLPGGLPAQPFFAIGRTIGLGSVTRFRANMKPASSFVPRAKITGVVVPIAS